jgi:hypothetical protein
VIFLALPEGLLDALLGSDGVRPFHPSQNGRQLERRPVVAIGEGVIEGVLNRLLQPDLMCVSRFLAHAAPALFERVTLLYRSEMLER